MVGSGRGWSQVVVSGVRWCQVVVSGGGYKCTPHVDKPSRKSLENTRKSVRNRQSVHKSKTKIFLNDTHTKFHPILTGFTCVPCN